MTYLENYQALAQALGWTMLHSVWQIGLIYVLFRLLRMLFRHNSAGYYGSLLAMTSSVVWAGLTFYATYRSRSGHSGANIPGIGPNPAIPVETGHPAPPMEASSWEPALTWLESHAMVFGCLWCAGILFFSLRLLGGYWLSHRLRLRSLPVADQQLSLLCRELADGLGIRKPVQILESRFIQSPLTLGFWKPVVLFPVGLALQLTPAQVEVLLLHELAHIRRYDYVVNLFQMALEVCFFYHPLFRLLSREADLCREFACDDLVLRHTGNPRLYATTLTEIKLYSVHPSIIPAMSAIGKSQFSTRIQRIMGFSPKNGD
ncbi:MAG: M56 family metallopeptidase, partial [Saprospiraceae bacterium]